MKIIGDIVQLYVKNQSRVSIEAHEFSWFFKCVDYLMCYQYDNGCSRSLGSTSCSTYILLLTLVKLWEENRYKGCRRKLNFG